ncbi:hypothetical protein MMC25_008176 [Agyrium rufum]|nr:hypothetical protein [Agyrium rufum]
MPWHPLQRDLTFYPAYCFNVSPTYNTWVKITAADVHNLYELPEHQGKPPQCQNVYFYINHPIRWVRLVGVLVAIEEFPFRWVLILDDGSGQTIELTCGRERIDQDITSDNLLPRGSATCNKMSGKTSTGRIIDLDGVGVGNVVKVKGSLGTFRGVKQIHLERLSQVQTTSEECEAWAESAAYHHDILAKPWEVSKRKQQRLRDRALGRSKINRHNAHTHKSDENAVRLQPVRIKPLHSKQKEPRVLSTVPQPELCVDPESAGRDRSRAFVQVNAHSIGLTEIRNDNGEQLEVRGENAPPRPRASSPALTKNTRNQLSHRQFERVNKDAHDGKVSKQSSTKTSQRHLRSAWRNFEAIL